MNARHTHWKPRDHGGRIDGRRLVSAGLLLLIAIAVPRAATGEGDPGETWTPSVGLGVLAQAQNVSGTAESSFPPRPLFETVVDGDPIVVVPVISAQLRLEAPALPRSRRRVRPFLHARVGFPVDEDRTILRAGNLPNPVVIPDDLPMGINAAGLSGQGTLGRFKLDLEGQVGVGASLDLPVWELPSRFSFSLDYMVQQTSLVGEVVYIFGTGPQEVAPFNVVRLHETEEGIFHYLGPRLEMEVPVWEQGNLRLHVFAELASLFVVGGRSNTVVASNGIDSARFDYKIDPWLISGGAGIRLSWEGL